MLRGASASLGRASGGHLPLARLERERHLLIQGAVPVVYQGECVGAIGVSGVQSHEDEQVAQAGANVIA